MAVTNTTIDMTWTAATDNVGVVSYHIYQSTDNVVYTEIHSTDGATYAYTAIGLSEGTKYYFKQTAKDAAGNESLYGNTVEATTLGEVGYTYLLDDYPGAAAAYSLRKLRTGVVNGIEVRRDSDDATTNVLLYDDPSKSIDLLSTVEAGGTLGDWVGANSAYVSTWYDQSGSDNNVEEDGVTSHMKIINSGVLEIENTLAALNNDNGDIATNGKLIKTAANIAITTQLSAFVVHRNNENSPQATYPIALQNGNSDGFRYHITQSTSLHRFRTLAINNDVINASLVVNQHLYSSVMDGVNLKSSVDGVNVFDNLYSGNLNINNDTDLSILKTEGTAYRGAGTVQEVILYPSDQSANRTAIETNINDHYNIWVVTAEVDAQLIQADADNVSDTVIEINGVRSSASDMAVANLISRNVTVITN